MVTRHPAARRGAQARRRRRRPGPGDLPRLARWRPDRASTLRAPLAEREPADDRLVRGPVGRTSGSTTSCSRSGASALELHVHARHRSATLRVGREATLPTSMVVREDSLTLFGFLDDDEKRDMFELRADRLRRRPQARPGDAVGASVPTSCAGRSPRERRQGPHRRARASAQKGAQRIILELKDRIGGHPRRRPGVGRVRARPGRGAVARAGPPGPGRPRLDRASEAAEAVEPWSPTPATGRRRRRRAAAARRCAR